MDFYIFGQQIINGITLGAIYGLIAVGYTMVYGVIRMINFAHGDVYMISSYVAAITLAVLHFWGVHSSIFALLLVLVVTCIITSFYGFAIERVAYRPLRSSTQLAPLISAIGISMLLQNYVQVSQGARDQGVPILISGGLRLGSEQHFIQITYMQIVILLASFAAMGILGFVISHTKLGRECRATQQNPNISAVLGVHTDRIISSVFVIGAATAAVGGVLVTLNYGSFNFFIGFIMGLKAFTATVLGGIGSLPGAILGGLVLGLTESLFAGYVNADYKDAFAFGLLILILVFRPHGLLGRPQILKV